MSTIDLIILGSLYQSPKSAYELQKQKVIQYEKKRFVLSETKKA